MSVDNTTLLVVSVGALATAISGNERIKGALHEDDEAAAGSACHPHCACARAAVELAGALQVAPGNVLACARCLYVRTGPASPAVTVMNGYALCDDHLGNHDHRTIAMPEQP